MTKKKYVIISILIIILLLLAAPFIFYKTALKHSALFLIHEDTVSKCDAAIVLSGESPARMLEAGDLYNEGYIKYVINLLDPESPAFKEAIKRGLPIPTQKEFIEKFLTSMGVPKESVLFTEEITDRTIEEAKSIKKLLQNHKAIKCLTVITSKYHLLRASKIFGKVFRDSEMKLIFHSPRFDDYSPDNWWKQPHNIRNTVGEYLKLFAMYFFGY